MPSQPRRFLSGITSRNRSNVLGRYGGGIDPSQYYTYSSDFLTFNEADWTITTVEAGAGSATEVCTDKLGGALLITNAAGDNDSDFLQLEGEFISLAATNQKEVFFRTKLQADDVSLCDVIAGIWIKTATDPIDTAPTDGIYFRCDNGDGNIDFVVMKNTTATTLTAVGTMADATDVELAFHWNGKTSANAITVWIDGVVVGTPALTNLPDDELLTAGFGVQNGSAVVRTLTVDHFFVAQER